MSEQPTIAQQMLELAGKIRDLETEIKNQHIEKAGLRSHVAVLERDVNTWKHKAQAVRLDPIEQENTTLKLRVRSLEKEIENKQDTIESYLRDTNQWRNLAQNRERDLAAAGNAHFAATQQLHNKIEALTITITRQEKVIADERRKYDELRDGNNISLGEITRLKSMIETSDEHVKELIDERDKLQRAVNSGSDNILNYIAMCMYTIAKDHGFHDGDEKFPTIAGLVNTRMSEYVANIHGEVSELWEAYRKDTWHMPCDKQINGAPIGLTCAEEELADTIIRCMDVSVAMNIQIGRAIRIKSEYNKTRSYRHGGKKA